MRDIKFRAYCKQLDIMQDPFDLLNDEGMLGKTGEIHLEDYVVMQYTGLKDKNGVEIYEDDIVDYNSSYYGHIIFANGFWIIRNIIKDKMSEELYFWDYLVKVVGNIHENPELLDEKK